MTQDGRAEELEPAKRRIMEATYRALQKHGYGNLRPTLTNLRRARLVGSFNSNICSRSRSACSSSPPR